MASLPTFDQPELERFTRTSGDLGHALCTVTVELPAGIRRASWDATVWQRDSAGDWRIAVDISTLLPS